MASAVSLQDLLPSWLVAQPTNGSVCCPTHTEPPELWGARALSTLPILIVCMARMVFHPFSQQNPWGCLVFKRFEAKRGSVGQVSSAPWGELPKGEGWMGSASHPAVHQAWGGTARRSCWFHAGARKAFLQKALECLVLADPERCELA